MLTLIASLRSRRAVLYSRRLKSQNSSRVSKRRDSSTSRSELISSSRQSGPADRNLINSRGCPSRLRLGGFFVRDTDRVEVGLRGRESTASPSTSPSAARLRAHGPLLFAERRTHHIA